MARSASEEVPETGMEMAETSRARPSPPPPSVMVKSKRLTASPMLSAVVGKATGSETVPEAVREPSELTLTGGVMATPIG